MVTLEEMLKFLPDQRLTQIVFDLAEQAHSLQLENAVLKKQNLELLEKQQSHEEKISVLQNDLGQIEEENQDNLDVIDSLKKTFRVKEGEMESQIAALQSDIAAKCQAVNAMKSDFKAKQAYNEHKMKELQLLHKLVLESKNPCLISRASILPDLIF